MAKKELNARCPFQNECERTKCDYRFKETQCPYYSANAMPGYEIEDQNQRSQEQPPAAPEQEENTQPSATPHQIVLIPIRKIFQHKDNPRKDLGDLTELAESINVNGILQNLTVVPNYGEITGTRLDTYTVIIGHRRLAAAKLAGLAEVPCVVTEMTPAEQLMTMLTENMQRSDLTTYEQAQGFQMMLDMGRSVEDIAKESGFSQSTVRRRVKLLSLDQDKFRKAEARGGTLQDYMELDKISDLGLKNSVLDAIGTPNFRSELKKALFKEETAKFIAARVADVSEWASEIDSSDGYEFVKNYGTWNWKKDSVVVRPDDADTVPYFYRVGVYQVDIYKKKVSTPETTEAERQKKEAREAAQKLRVELSVITRRYFELRQDFVCALSPSTVKAHMADVSRFATYYLVPGYGGIDGPDESVLCKMLDSKTEDDMERLVEEKVAVCPEYVFLVCLYAACDSPESGYYSSQWNVEWHGSDYVYRKNENLDQLYILLQAMGYEMSEEEQAMQAGTHELFQQ